MAAEPQVTLVSTTDSLQNVQAALGIKPDAAAPAATSPAAPAAPASAEPVKAAVSDAAATAAPEPKPKRDGLQARIDELVKQRDTARGTSAAQEAELTALRDRVRELAGAQAPIKAAPSTEEPVAKTKPNVQDFPDYDAYVEALIDWKAEQIADTRVKSALDAEKKTESTEAEERRTREILAAHADRIKEAKTRYNDFDEVVGRPEMMISQVMRDGIVLSEIGGDVAHYLATHDAKRESLLQLGNTPQAMMAFGELVAAVKADMKARAKTQASDAVVDPTPAAVVQSAAAPAEPAEPAAPATSAARTAPVAAATAVTRAPDPITPVSGAVVTTTVKPDQMSYAEFKRYRENQLKERQAAGVR